MRLDQQIDPTYAANLSAAIDCERRRRAGAFIESAALPPEADAAIEAAIAAHGFGPVLAAVAMAEQVRKIAATTEGEGPQAVAGKLEEACQAAASMAKTMGV